MKILDAFKVADRCIGLVLDREVDFNYNRISIDGIEYSFNCASETLKCISIPISSVDISSLIGKEIEFVA